jgi:chemotaxis receptor (MCP) glutamine deamidase CheD
MPGTASRARSQGVPGLGRFGANVSVPTNGAQFRDPLLKMKWPRPASSPGMISSSKEILVPADAFRVAGESLLLVSELRAALAVCLHDDTQAVGGLLHLRYVATGGGDQPIDLTDNTLSSDLLLMDSFCKELRSAGARKQSWRVSIFGHTPEAPALQGPAATVIDLAKGYFADARLPVECKEFRRGLGLLVRFDPREGRIWVNGTPGTATAKLAAPVGA